MTSRKTRARIAQETVDILKAGRYKAPDGHEVSISSKIKEAKKGTCLYSPNRLDELLQGLEQPEQQVATRLTVDNCTTLCAARQLLSEQSSLPLCLNFASAKHPGGGFLNGSQAQEESLARASALYASINPVREYYESNRECGTSLYTHHMIYSPGVPVFRDDDDQFLEAPYLANFVTAPAVNSGAVKQHEPNRIAKIEPVMVERIARVLAVAAANQCDNLVLGAWGCGVFQNDPKTVAEWFRAALFADVRFKGRFSRIVFAVLDKSEGTPTYEAFATTFA